MPAQPNLVHFRPQSRYSSSRTPVIPLSHLICAIDAVSEDIGPIIVPSETNQPDLNLIDIAECGEIDQGVYCFAFICGKLRSCLFFWRATICAADFVLDIIENGYKIRFKETPIPYSIENRSSAKSRDSFVGEVISELLVRGCIRQVATYPKYCNPLHVAVQSSGKLRLILILSHLNNFVVKNVIKYEDLRCVLLMFPCGMFGFCFDLKSAYHHIDICDEHTQFFSFKWPSEDGQLRFYEFKFLPFWD